MVSASVPHFRFADMKSCLYRGHGFSAGEKCICLRGEERRLDLEGQNWQNGARNFTRAQGHGIIFFRTDTVTVFLFLHGFVAGGVVFLVSGIGKRQDEEECGDLVHIGIGGIFDHVIVCERDALWY